MRGVAAALGLIAPAAAAVAQDLAVGRLTTIDGRTGSGVVSMTEDGTVLVAPHEGAALAAGLADVLAVDCGGEAVASAPMHVWLRSGSVLPATAVDGTAPAAGRPAALAIATAAGARVVVPLSAVAALRLRAPEPRTFADDRAAPDTNLDYLYVVKDGQPQRFSVTVGAIHDQRVHFDLRGRAYDYALAGADATAAIVFGKNTGFPPDRQGKPRVLVTLRSGERVEGRLLRLHARLLVRLDEGAELDVAASLLQRLDVLSDKLTWLGSLAPQVEQVPAFDRTWPWTVDRSPAGPGIVLGGKTYERGLVLVPRTRLTYDLGGRYDRFEAVIGIDARGGPQSHAIFRVLTDGALAFESAPMTLADPAQPIRVELGRCRLLTLEADFGKNFDLGDLCAFAEARVVQR
jgi:hypothetical protein